VPAETLVPFLGVSLAITLAPGADMLYVVSRGVAQGRTAALVSAAAVNTGSTVNGPLLLRGEVEIRSADGNTVYRGSRGSLCRCGHSNNKPFCYSSPAEMDWHDD
jgi:hypothetical protein